MVDSATVTSGTMDRALAAQTLCEAFEITAAASGGEIALRAAGEPGAITWDAYAQRARRVAAGLAVLGVGRGDTVGVMLVNRPEFHWIDAGAMLLGAVPFSIYNTSATEQIEFLLADAANRVVIIERAFEDRLAQVRAPTLEHTIVIDAAADGALSLEQLEALGAREFEVDAAARAVAPDDLLTLIYTSGTTGPPKGVQLTHANMLCTMRGYRRAIPEMGRGRTASYLPMAHVLARWLDHYHPMWAGGEVTCVADPRAVIAALPTVRPTRFIGVPRVWEKLKAGLEAAMSAEPDPQRREATRWALDVGLRVVRARQSGNEPDEQLAREHAQAEQLVLARIRGRLGLDELDLAGVGAAPTPLEVLEFFHALGIPVVEGWAMSETASGGTINSTSAPRLGTVGRPLPGVEIRLGEDREVLVRGDNVMAGYRNQPERTAAVIDAEGWLHTGDIGEIDDDGFLRIVDRKKELIINAAGKNMSPANIEARLKTSSPLIGHAVALGDARPYNVALIVLDPDNIAAFAGANGLLEGAVALAEHPDVVAEVTAAVKRANQHLSRVEQIKRFTILAEDWPPGGDELTPTMKLKRKPIAAKYAALIDEMYTRVDPEPDRQPLRFGP
jgi:long-subunit acyl-CoA synthetase (AMP-forming)